VDHRGRAFAVRFTFFSTLVPSDAVYQQRHGCTPKLVRSASGRLEPHFAVPTSPGAAARTVRYHGFMTPMPPGTAVVLLTVYWTSTLPAYPLI
jgi:hypothetical protein